MPHGQKTKNIKQKQCCNKSNKDFENGPHQKNRKKYILPEVVTKQIIERNKVSHRALVGYYTLVTSYLNKVTMGFSPN